MTPRERFAAIMTYRPFDRLSVYYFGTWEETLDRWLKEGLTDRASIPKETGLDGDWEGDFWHYHGLANPDTISDVKPQVLEETDTYRVVRTALGGVMKQGKLGSTIPMHLEENLKPTREDWKRFKKFVDSADPRRRPDGWEAAADKLNARRHVTCFFCGGLYGTLRGWLGTENATYLAYDDPALYEEIIEYIADHFMIVGGPVLQRVQFEFGYFFEDCCFNFGPLLSPDMYRKFYDRHYRRMIAYYRGLGLPLIMLDSDGKVDALVEPWLDSGVDIVFPIEVGTWRANPLELRRRFGRRLRMFGGVDKHVIPRGEAAIRAELEPLRPLAAEGGFIPIPDHRIPPDCSLDQFRTYVRVFKDVFGKM